MRSYSSIKKSSSSILTILFTVALIFLLAFPARVFAADETPGVTPPDSSTTVPANSSAEPVPAASDATVETQTAVIDPKAALLPAAAEATSVPPTEVSEAPATVALSEAPAAEAIATAEVTIEQAFVPDPAMTTAGDTNEIDPVASEKVAEIFSAAAEAEVTLANTEGETLSAVAIETVEMLTSDSVDPFFYSGSAWIGYTIDGLNCPTGVTCNSSSTPLQAAISAAPSGATVYVAAQNYNENVTINKIVSLIGFLSTTGSITSNTFNGYTGYTLAPAYTTSFTLESGADILNAPTVNVFAHTVNVNTGASIADGISLVEPDGTVKTKVTIQQGNSYNDWKGYGYLTAYVNDSSLNGAPIYQLECGEPNKDIYLGQTYNMTLMFPTNPYIVDYYNQDGAGTSQKELHDLCIAVNLAQVQGWSSNTKEDLYKQQQVYWRVLNKTYNKQPLFDPKFDEIVNKIKAGDYNSTPMTVGVYFLVPMTTNNAGVMSNDPNVQLTFLQKTCDDGNASTANSLNPDGTCSFSCTNGATNAPTCTAFPPTTPPVTTTTTITGTAPQLLIPVTGAGICEPDIITAGIAHTCAVTPETGLRCWGQNDTGQLGNSKNDNSSLPVKVKVLDGREVISLVSGTKHTCALTSSGEVMCWGLNYSGQLGDGTNTNSNIPVKVAGLSGTIVAISAGENFTCAVNDANTTMCWGNNSAGQFKNGTSENTNTPVVASLGSNVSMVSGGQNELQGVTTDGAVQFWSNQPSIPVTGLTSKIAIVSADRFCEGGCAMNTEGKVECWGAIPGTGISGGQQTDPLEIAKVKCQKEPLVTGKGHGCMVTDNGLVCWGENDNGQLGDGTQKGSEQPVAVTGINSVIDLAAGYKHNCAVVGVEEIQCWGNNSYGQLGNGTTVESPLPVTVQ